MSGSTGMPIVTVSITVSGLYSIWLVQYLACYLGLGEYCTSTERIAGRSRMIGGHVSPASAEALTWPPGGAQGRGRSCHDSAHSCRWSSSRRDCHLFKRTLTMAPRPLQGIWDEDLATQPGANSLGTPAFFLRTVTSW